MISTESGSDISLSRARKGQFSHIFTFLIAIIVIVATIYVAVRLISGFGGAACDASVAEFQRSLLQALGANANYGSRNSITLAAPCEAQELCFVDSRMVVPSGSSVSSSHGIIRTNAREGVEENIYLFSDDLFSFYDERIILSGPEEPAPQSDLCIMSTGSFTFRTEGHGRYVKVAAQ